MTIAAAVAASLLSPGLLTSEPVRTAAIVGGCAAAVSGAIGVFTVLRGLSFAGHALADISSAGGAASFLLGINPLLGFAIMGVLGAGAMASFRTDGAHERELVTGVVLGAGLGLSALLLYLDVTAHSTTGAAITVMFGSIFAIPPTIVPLALLVAVGALGTVALLYRPLLLMAVDPSLAAARGVPVRTVGLLHLMALALAVSLAAVTTGAILSTALLIGPTAIAFRLTRRPARAIGLAILVGVAATWLGIAVAYDSVGWTGRSWPVSFCIVLVLFVAYLISVHVRVPRRATRAAHRVEI